MRLLLLFGFVVLVVLAVAVYALDFTGSVRVVVESSDVFTSVFSGSSRVGITSSNAFDSVFSGSAGVVVVEEGVTNGSSVTGSFVGGTPCWYFSSADKRVCVLASFPDSVVGFSVGNVSGGSWVAVVPDGVYDVVVPPQNVSVVNGGLEVIIDLRGHSGYEWLCLYDVAINHTYVNGSVIDVNPLKVVYEVKGEVPLCSSLRSSSNTVTTTSSTLNTTNPSSGGAGGGAVVIPVTSNYFTSNYLGSQHDDVVHKREWVVSFIRSNWVIMLLLLVGALLLLSSASGKRRR